MLAQDYISPEMGSIQNDQSIGNALDLIALTDASHIPLFDGKHFLGNMSKINLEDFDPESLISETYPTSDLEKFSIADTATIFDAMTVFRQYEANTIPIFERENHYIGNVFLWDINEALSKFPFFAEAGAILIVRVPTKKYSLSEVTKIVESNNARLFGVMVYRFNTDSVDILVKLLSENLASVGETFERFGYLVVQKFFTDEKELFIKDRYEQFMKFLDI